MHIITSLFPATNYKILEIINNIYIYIVKYAVVDESEE